MDATTKAWMLAIMKTLVELQDEVHQLRGGQARKGPDVVSEVQNRVRMAANEIQVRTINPI